MPNTNQSIKVISSGRDLQSVAMEGAENCKMQELITEKKNAAPNFSMRFFEIEPQGHTPQHSHPWEHEIYVLEGEGEIRGETNVSFHSSDALLIPPNTLHQFYNSGKAPLKFLCIIPNNANYEKK
ncbi:MAG: cupin domain-containing protein [Candidatus Melainabacteria bacterium]